MYIDDVYTCLQLLTWLYYNKHQFFDYFRCISENEGNIQASMEFSKSHAIFCFLPVWINSHLVVEVGSLLFYASTTVSKRLNHHTHFLGLNHQLASFHQLTLLFQQVASSIFGRLPLKVSIQEKQ